MRHAPAEFFIKYLCSRPGSSANDVKTYLSGMGVGLMPTATYVDEIYAEVQSKLPVNYSPRDRSHRPSVRFLRKERIYGLWHSTVATKRAIALFLNGSMREVAEALLLTTMCEEEIAKTLAFVGEVDVCAESVKEYRHYFWNTKLVSYDEWARYLTDPHIQALKLTALKSPKNPDGIKLALYKIGLMPTDMNKKHMLINIRDISYMNFLESNGFAQGLKKSTMLLNYGTLVRNTQDKLDEYEAGEQDVIAEFYKHVEVTAQTKRHPTLIELEGEHSEPSTRQLPAGEDQGGDG